MILEVDYIIERQKIFMRKLAPSLEIQGHYFRGIAILANGEAGMILDPNTIMDHYCKNTNLEKVA